MKPIFLITTVLAWIALAAPSQAAAFTGAAYAPAANPAITIHSSRSQFDRFAGRGFYFKRFDHQYRSRGFRSYGRGNFLPARAISRSLRARQFHRISLPRLRRGFYHVRARDAYGRRVRLIIDPYNGNILRLRFRH